MAFKEINSLDADNAIALGGFNRKTNKANPTSVEGYYLGTRQVPSQKSKTGFADLHIFQTAKGNLGVWGKTDMDKKVRQVPPGSMTRVEFAGMKPTKMGNDMYTFKVSVDSENTIEVSTPAPQNETTDDDNGYEASSDSDDTDEIEEAFETPVRQAPVNNDRAAKVAALLKGKK